MQEVEKVFASLSLDSELLREVIAYIKNSAHLEQNFHKQRIGELHAEHSKIKTRIDKLTDLFLDGDISKKVHEEKRQELVQKRENVMREIKQHNNPDDNFSERLISLVELASSAFETFQGSTVEGKRKLINFVFANLELKGEKLDFTLRPPFDMFIKCTKIEEWCALKDSNL